MLRYFTRSRLGITGFVCKRQVDHCEAKSDLNPVEVFRWIFFITNHASPLLVIGLLVVNQSCEMLILSFESKESGVDFKLNVRAKMLGIVDRSFSD